MRQRIMRHQVCEVITFSGFGPQELSPRRRVEKQIAHADGRAAGMRSVFYIAQATAFDHHAGRGVCLARVSYQLDPGHGCD